MKSFLSGAIGPFAGIYHSIASADSVNWMFMLSLLGIALVLLLGIGMRITLAGTDAFRARPNSERNIEWACSDTRGVGQRDRGPLVKDSSMGEQAAQKSCERELSKLSGERENDVP